MSWKRLDDKPLKNIGMGSPKNTSRQLAFRVYGWNGKRWPRLVIGVFFSNINHLEDVGSQRFTARRLALSVDVCLRPGQWWQSTVMPTHLLGDAAEMLIEAGTELKRRLAPAPACSHCDDKGGISSCNECGKVMAGHAAWMAEHGLKP